MEGLVTHAGPNASLDPGDQKTHLWVCLDRVVMRPFHVIKQDRTATCPSSKFEGVLSDDLQYYTYSMHVKKATTVRVHTDQGLASRPISEVFVGEPNQVVMRVRMMVALKKSPTHENLMLNFLGMEILEDVTGMEVPLPLASEDLLSKAVEGLAM